VPAPDSTSSPIHLQVSDGIARLTLDRPPLNVLDIETLRVLNDALRECDDSSVRVVLLRSAIARGFSAGVAIADHRPERLERMLDEVRENARLLLGIGPITVAAVNGTTLGGGAELALLCDLVIAADDLELAFPEIRLAAFPPVAAALLAERCGGPQSMRLLLGESIDAATARQLGLVGPVVAVNKLTQAAEELAHRIAGYSGVALRGLVRSTRGQRANQVLQRLDAAIAAYRALVGPSTDAQEGISAFFEKRTPVWRHR
jgi:cyclohexa-1,5-dienecarbonyl-CoA hydratase